jgi:tetratricopeptide (TPR) repeat protein
MKPLRRNIQANVMTLAFKTTKGPDPKGYFYPENPSAWARLHRDLRDASRKFSASEISGRECIMKCMALLEREPSFLGALALINDCLMTENVTMDANFLKLVSTYLSPVRALIPQGFKGQLDDSVEENIYFLSASLFLLLALVSMERYPEALTACAEHARWQRDSSTRAIAGNIRIATRELDLAEKVFTADPVPMPYESAFSLGLVKFLQGRLAEAAELLRRAVILQPYVPEILLSRASQVNYSWNLPDNEGMYSNAFTYCNIYMGHKVWSDDPECLAFLNWVYSCPDMMAERAKGLGILDRMLRLPPGREAEAGELGRDFIRFANTPNPRLVKKILQPVPRGEGKVNPWELCIWSESVNSIMEELFEGFSAAEDAASGALPRGPSASPMFAPDWGAEAEAGLPDGCGDCEECDIFDECQSSSSIDDDGCTGCEECEIEGFCQGEDGLPFERKDKKPPVRH